MRLLDRLFTRRRGLPDSSGLLPQVRRRMVPACLELSAAEEAIAARLGLPSPPRLLLVDEEQAVVLTPVARATIEGTDPPARQRGGSA